MAKWIKRLYFSGRLLAILVLLVFALHETKDPFQVRPDLAFQPPSANAWFGTDRLGRDLFSRTGRALRNTVVDAGFAALLGFLTAFGLALLSVWRGVGTRYFNAGVDVFSASLRSIPIFLPAMTFAVLFRNTLYGPIIALYAISLTYSLPVHRVELRRAYASPFIEGTVSLGATTGYILARCIVPDVMPRLFRYALLDFSSLVAFASLLGVVGLNSPPEPDIGSLVYNGRLYLADRPWLFLAPSIILVVFLMLTWSLTALGREE